MFAWTRLSGMPSDTKVIYERWYKTLLEDAAGSTPNLNNGTGFLTA